LIPTSSAQLAGIVLKIISVTGATPGTSPTVSFSAMDKSGNPLDISKLTALNVILAGPNVDYGVAPAGLRVSESALKASGTNGVYTYTMTNVIPAAAAGSYTIAVESRNSVTLNAGTTISQAVIDDAQPVRAYFSVDSSPAVARRQVVATAKCLACHVDLKFVHSGVRNDAMECPICHNPTLTDGTSKQSVNMAWQIHSIHRGDALANPYVLGTANYQSVRFPGDLRDCTTCHLPGTYLPENVGAVANVASPGGFTPTTPPISAACQGCHDDVATAVHTLSNSNALGEACVVCHGAGAEFSVDRVHQRIF
jgi:OmcA/MtrC family decaheme c-type cytochrome